MFNQSKADTRGLAAAILGQLAGQDQPFLTKSVVDADVGSNHDVGHALDIARIAARDLPAGYFNQGQSQNR